jgi:hypothetical protein
MSADKAIFLPPLLQIGVDCPAATFVSAVRIQRHAVQAGDGCRHSRTGIRETPTALPRQGDEAMEGSIRPSRRIDWELASAFDEKVFLRGLEEMGIDPQPHLAEYRKAAAVVSVSPELDLKRAPHFHGGPDALEEYLSEKRRSRWESFKEWLSEFLGIYRFETTESKTTVRDIPLFELHCPKVNGSKVTYSESMSEGLEGSWTVTVFGTGMGANQELTAKYSSTFSAENGECKLIFVPVTFHDSAVRVYKKDELIGKRLRSEATAQEGETHFNKGAASLQPDTCTRRPLGEEMHEIFPLGKDRSGTIATYERTWETTGEVEISLGLEAFNLNTETRVKIQHSRSIGLTFELPAGHDYRLERLRNKYGLVWRVE